ncbi:MAG: efflux RND transporter periplasmic adaptor subunit [Bacteroidales bacterium]|nr:efflux RND transporter periplasmic adaptor subunit [Bacteroidales bacterium]
MKIHFVAIVGLATVLMEGCNGQPHHSHEAHEEVGEEIHEHAHTHLHDDGGRHHEGEEHEHSQAHADEISMNHHQIEAAGVAVDVVKADSFSTVIRVSGKVCPLQGDELTVVAPSDGVVTFADASLTAGTAVGLGETLAWVSGSKLQRGDAAQQAKLVFETARKELERAQRLVAEKIMSVKEYEQVALHYETAKAAIQGMDLTGRGTSVQSMMRGYVKQLLVRQGEYVSVGQPLAVVAQNRRLQLQADVPERYFKHLHEVNGANFRMAYDEALHKLADLNGHVLSYGKTVVGGASFVPLTFEFDNVGDVLPGAFAEIFLFTRQRGNVVSLPLKAITEEQGFHYVYLQVHEGAFRRQQVTLGQSDGERVEICEGLAEGDRVVTHGAYQVKMASVAKAVPGHTHHH